MLVPVIVLEIVIVLVIVLVLDSALLGVAPSRTRTTTNTITITITITIAITITSTPASEGTGPAIGKFDSEEYTWDSLGDAPIDTFTHGFAGYLIGRTCEPGLGRRVTAAAVLGSVLPDADHFIELAGSAPYLELHRGWSHSVVAAAAWAAVSAILFGRGRRPRERIGIATVGALGLAGHILMDCITAFGTVWLVPFSPRRYALDWVFIVDPTFSGILLLAMAVGWIRPRQAARAAAAGLAVVALYLGLCAWNHSVALARVERWAAERWPDVQASAALPLPPHAFGWRGLVRTTNEIHEVRFTLPGGEPRWLEPVAAANLERDHAPHTRELAALAGMARFLSEQRSPLPDAEQIVFFDRQFAAIPGGRVYEVTVIRDRSGRVVESRFSDASVAGRTALYLLLLAFLAARIRRWERAEAGGSP